MPCYRLANGLPSREVARLRWTGGDSTLQRMGSVDWGAGVNRVVGIEEASRPLQEAMSEEVTGEVLIAIGELLAFLILAATLSSDWENLCALYVSDNENTREWLAERRAKNRMARHCLRLLQQLEARHYFQVVAAGVYTKHNLSADLATRPGPRGASSRTRWVGSASGD